VDSFDRNALWRRRIAPFTPLPSGAPRATRRDDGFFEGIHAQDPRDSPSAPAGGFPQGHLVCLCPIPPSGRPSRMGGWIPSAWQAQSSSAARAWASAVPAGISACSRTPLSPLVAIARWTRTPSRAYRDRSGAMMVSRMRKDGQQRAWLALTWDSRRQCAHDDQNPPHRAGFHSSHAQAPP